jgi:hypothetical protein
MLLTGLPLLLALSLLAEPGTVEPIVSTQTTSEVIVPSSPPASARSASTRSVHSVVGAGIRFFGPLQASLAFAAGASVSAQHGPYELGGFLEVEPGIAGFQFNAGAFRSNGWGSESLRVAYLRRWGHPAGAADHEYLGLEPALMFAYVKVSLGAYHRLWSPSASAPLLFGATLGLGFP